MDLRSTDQEVGDKEGDGVTGRDLIGSRGVDLGDPAQPIGVVLVVLVGGLPDVEGPPLPQKGKAADDGSSRQRLEIEDCSVLRALDVADEMNVLQPEKGRKRFEETR